MELLRLAEHSGNFTLEVTYHGLPYPHADRTHCRQEVP